MNCPKCGNELKRSQKNPEFGLCYNCKLKFRWIEETPLPEPEEEEEEVYEIEPKRPAPSPARYDYHNNDDYDDDTDDASSPEDSYFDGGVLQLIGWKLLGGLITSVTCGLGYPFACCLIYDWETKHTVINGHRLRFTGSALQLFGLWLKWILLTIITLGIYGFWVGIRLRQWKIKNTEFDD